MTLLLVLDDDKVYADYLAELCRQQLGFEAVVETSPQQAFEVIVNGGIDLVLCDVRMPRMSGVEFTRIINGLVDPPGVVGITAFDEDANIIEMLRAGALGMVLKAGPEEHLREALLQAEQGRGYISPLISARVNNYLLPVIGTRATRELTTREQRIVDLVIRGLSNTEIAEDLHISVATVKKELKILFHLFGVSSRIQLVVAAMRG